MQTSRESTSDRSSCVSKINSAFNYLIYLQNPNEYTAPSLRFDETRDRGFSALYGIFDDAFASDKRETMFHVSN